MNPATPLRLPLALASLLLVLAVVLGTYVRDIAKAIDAPIPPLPMPYGGSLLDNLLAAAIAVLLAALLLARGSVTRALGLQRNGVRGPALVLLATLPCWAGLYLLGDANTSVNLLSLLMLALLFPLAEEILFRGLGVIFAVRVLRWPWWLAAVVQAIAFGGVHWMGSGGVDGGGMAAIVFAVTGIGGFLFAWLNRLDGSTIWSGLALHVSLNLAWSLIAVPDALALGWQSIGLRLGAGLLAVLLLWRLLPARSRQATPL